MAESGMPERLGRYEVVRELGKGAMGVVYEGKDPNIGRRVAIKTARRDVMEATGMGDEMMKRFLREAQAAGALNHPNIITIYDAAEEGDMAYIAMEYLEGGDLADLIEGKKRLGVEEVIDIGAAVCDALAVAHAAGVVHRDIKPANIMMPRNGPVKVADFGIARVQDSNLTQEGALIGTPHYMSPEQFMGQRVDGRSDLFSVGNILYELITGEKPFTGEQLSTVMHHVIRTDPVPPRELNFAISGPLDGVVMKALSKRPDERFQTAQAMAAALRECLKADPDPAVLAGMPVGAGADATVMGDAGATVINGDTGATLAGVDATVAGGPPPGAEATVAGGPPPGVEAAPKPGIPKALVGGAVAVLALVVVAASVLLGGGDEEPAGNGGGAGTVTPPAAWYSGIYFEVYRARTEEAFLDWDGTEATIGDAQEAAGCEVRVYDQDTGALLASAPDYESATKLTWPEKQPARLRYEVLEKGQVVHEGALPGEAEQPEETQQTQLVMMPPAP